MGGRVTANWLWEIEPVSDDKGLVPKPTWGDDPGLGRLEGRDCQAEGGSKSKGRLESVRTNLGQSVSPITFFSNTRKVPSLSECFFLPIEINYNYFSPQFLSCQGLLACISLCLPIPSCHGHTCTLRDTQLLAMQEGPMRKEDPSSNQKTTHKLSTWPGTGAEFWEEAPRLEAQARCQREARKHWWDFSQGFISASLVSYQQHWLIVLCVVFF